MCLFCATAVMITGCRQESTQAPANADGRSETPPVRSTSSGSPTTSPAEVGLQGVDARDDPDAPQAVPHSNQLIDWVKVEPVRVRAPENVAEIVEDERIIALTRLFPLDRIARTAYQQADTLADVVFIEAKSPLDAYGFYSVSTASQGQFNRADGSVRTVESLDDGALGDGRRLHAAWQGDTCILVRCGPAEPEGHPDLVSCEPVLSKIVFEIPSEDPPLLLFAVPANYRESSRFWCVRTTRALPADAHPVLAQIEPEEMDRRLGLTGKAMLHLAAVQVEEGEPDNLIWVAEYTEPAAALAAYERYQTALGGGTLAIDAHTLVVEPVGRRLAGSWTAGQESIQKLLPLLQAMLKRE